MNADKTEFLVSDHGNGSEEHLILNHWFGLPELIAEAFGVSLEQKEKKLTTVEGENINQRVNKF